MASKTNKKSKKPIETTLGKAKPKKSEEEIDISSVRKPIETHVSGLQQAIALLETATEEVKNYVMYECDIMYECRVCRNIFRSLANFILHKRNYCGDKFNPLDYLNNNRVYQEVVYPHPDVNHQNVKFQMKPKEKEKKTLNPVIDKLLEKHKIEKLCKEIVGENLSNFEKISPLDKPVKNMDDCEIKLGNSSTIVLEKIDSNNAAVFQTFLQNDSDKNEAGSDPNKIEKSKKLEGHTEKIDKVIDVDGHVPKLEDVTVGVSDIVKNVQKKDVVVKNGEENVSMKSQVMEIYGILENDKVVVGPDGKLNGYYKEKSSGITIPEKYLICTECNVRFTTKKTLTFHLRTRHNSTGKIYFCPNCKELLANPWCVFRHLIKVHRMSTKQVKNMREKIHNSWVIQENASTIDIKKKPGEPVPNSDAPTDAENQWINNVEEDNDLQMCAGCGKRFERRAALHSHSVMCAKRIAVCANIKENNAKKREEEEAYEKARQKQALDCLRGASKRKGQIVRRKTSFLLENVEETGVEYENLEHSKHIETLNNITVIPESSADIKSPTREMSVALTRQRVEDMEKQFIKQLTEEKSLNEDVDLDFINTQIKTVPEVVNNRRLSRSSKKSIDEPQILSCIDEDLGFNVKETQNKEDQTSDLGNSSDLSTSESSFERCERFISNKIPKYISVLNNKKRKLKGNSYADEEHKGKNNKLKKVKSLFAHHCKEENVTDLVSKDISQLKTKTQTSTVNSDQGFAGFSEDEISDISKYVNKDLSALSYNNPLRRLQRIKSVVGKEPRPKYKRPTKKMKTVKDKQTFYDERETVFINKAAPYMDQEKLSCISCILTFPSFSLLLWHMSAHFSWFRFQCSKCTFISFNKTDCMAHAKQEHRLLRETSINSVVLPVPSWKSLLMSHEFRLLKGFDNFTGKHTDEAILPEVDSSNSSIEDFHSTDTNSGDLFSDCDKKSADLPSIINIPSTSAEISDVIDILEQSEDSQMLNEPDELAVMPPDISEVFDNFKYKEYVPFEERTPVHELLEDSSNDDTEFYSMIFEKIEAPNKNLETVVKKDRSCTPNLEDVFYKKDSQSPRLSRVRTKTKLHEDFIYYDLNSVPKLIDTSKSTSSKVEKSISPLLQKRK